MENEVSAEVHFAQKLAANEKKIRDKAIKRLSRYLSVRSSHGTGLSEPDLLKIWKGLFYCMWMQDKPLIQEELSQRITKLMHCLPKAEDSLRFVRVFLETVSREWNGIDRLRLDKFMMLVRDMVHQVFLLLSNDGWSEKECCTFALSLGEHIMCPHKPRLPDGPKLHFSDIFVEELRKVPLEKLSTRALVVLLHPFLDFILFTDKIELARRVMSDVVYKVLRSSSETADKVKGKSKDVAAVYEADKMDVDVDVDVSDEQKAAKAEDNQFFHLDKDCLLKPMFGVARRKGVRAANRALIYNLVKKHSKNFDDIANSGMSSDQTWNCENKKQTGESSFCYLQLLKDDGKAVDQQQVVEQHKKKKCRKKGKIREENMEAGSSSPASVSVGAADLAGSKKTKAKKQKTDSVNDENASRTHKKKLISSTGQANSEKTSEKSEMQQADSKSPVLGDNADLRNKLNNKNSRNKTPVLDVNNSAKGSSNTANDVVSRKRKLITDDGEGSSSKKLKVDQSEGEEESKSSPRKKKASSNEDIVLGPSTGESPDKATSDHPTEKDANFSARPKCRSVSPPKTFSEPSPIELITYSPKVPTYCIAQKDLATSPPKTAPTSSVGMADVVTVPSGKSEETDADKNASVQLEEKAESPKRHSRKSPSTGRVRLKSESPRKAAHVRMKPSSVSLSGIVGELCSALTVPCTVMSKALANIAPRAEKRTPELDVKATPPGSDLNSKKKVIFDLRRNKANKFQDYLKSIARQPDTPFEPSKSPTVGILKSPANSPALSQSSSDLSFLDTDESTSSLSTKKSRSGFKKAASAQGILGRTSRKKKKKSVHLNTGHNQFSSASRRRRTSKH